MASCARGAERGWRPSPAGERFPITRFMPWSEPDGLVVGTVDEDFAVESNRGDIMLLGNTSWMIRRIETNTGRVLVQDAHGAPPSVPFWNGEAPARTEELSDHIGVLRQKISEMLPKTSPVGFSATQPDV